MSEAARIPRTVTRKCVNTVEQDTGLIGIGKILEEFGYVKIIEDGEKNE